MKSQAQAIAEGTVKLYEIIEDYEEGLALIDCLDSFHELDEKPAHLRDLNDAAQLYALAKAFADRVYGAEAREIINGLWDGSVLGFFSSFWQRPNSEIGERIAACRWASSMEGISDLRKFWGVHPRDVTTDELSAFSRTLPIDSATKVAFSGYEVPLNLVVEAQGIDLQKLRLKQASGKSGRLPEAESMTALLRKRTLQAGPNGSLHQHLAQRERERLQAEKRAQREKR